MSHVARTCVIAFDIVLLAAALGNDLAAFEERIADVDRLVEQAARVGAKVHHIAERMPAGRLVDCNQRRLGLVPNIAREGVDVDDADAVLDLPLDRAKLDPLAHHRDVEGLVAAGADDGQLDRSAGVAPHLRDRFVEVRP